MLKDLTIGKLADAAGVNVETIRYYQRSAYWMSHQAATRWSRKSACALSNEHRSELSGPFPSATHSSIELIQVESCLSGIW